MGVGGIGITELLVILGIVVLLFGTKRLRSLGSDLGSAIRGFKSSLREEDGKTEDKPDVAKSVENQDSGKSA